MAHPDYPRSGIAWRSGPKRKRHQDGPQATSRWTRRVATALLLLVTACTDTAPLEADGAPSALPPSASPSTPAPRPTDVPPALPTQNASASDEAASPPPLQRVVAVELGVFKIQAGAEARERFALDGSLAVEGGCVWAVEGPASAPRPIEWPFGWVASFDAASGGFALIGPDGGVVARRGDVVDAVAVPWTPPAARCQSVSDRPPLRLFAIRSVAPG